MEDIDSHENAGCADVCSKPGLLKVTFNMQILQLKTGDPVLLGGGSHGGFPFMFSSTYINKFHLG